MRRGALRRLRRELPSAADQRATLAGCLRHLGEAETAWHPETAQASRARALEMAMVSLGARELDEATDAQVAELFVLHRLLLSEPGEAGRLAQEFRTPAQILQLRDDLTRAAQKRAEFDRQCLAFEATCEIWESTGTGEQCLLDKLKAMAAPDPDLWHHIVQNYDVSDPVEEQIALWCLAQPQIEKATVALFLRRVLACDRPEEAVRKGDLAFLAVLRAHLSAYPRLKNRTIGIATAADPKGAHAAAMALLSRVAEATGTERPTLPGDVYSGLTGRTVQRRDHWHRQIGPDGARALKAVRRLPRRGRDDLGPQGIEPAGEPCQHRRVDPCAERPSGTGQDHGAQAGFLHQALAGPGDLREHRLVPGVHLFGAVQGDLGHAVFDGDRYAVVGHGVLSRSQAPGIGRLVSRHADAGVAPGQAERGGSQVVNHHSRVRWKKAGAAKMTLSS